MTDLRRSISIALFGIAVGAFMDTHIGVQTRPEQIYFSQAIIAFSTLYFLGPMMIEGIIEHCRQAHLHIMSYSAVFGVSQIIWRIRGAAIFGTFITYRTSIYLADALIFQLYLSYFQCVIQSDNQSNFIQRYEYTKCNEFCITRSCCSIR